MDILVHIPMLSISGLLLSEKACWLLIYVLDSVFMGRLDLSDIPHCFHLEMKEERKKRAETQRRDAFLSIFSATKARWQRKTCSLRYIPCYILLPIDVLFYFFSDKKKKKR